MKKTRTTRSVELTIEQTELTAVRAGSGQLSAWCDGCGRRSRFVTTEKATQISGGSLRETFRQIEAGTVHFKETPEGAVLVCLTSLVTFDP